MKLENKVKNNCFLGNDYYHKMNYFIDGSTDVKEYTDMLGNTLICQELEVKIDIALMSVR